MKINSQQFLDDGFIILRQVVPPDQLGKLRNSYEILIDKLGGHNWLQHGAQPRLTANHLIDETTTNTVEFWLHDNTLGVSRELMRGPEAAVTEMFLMCSPLRDHGPADWHRDFSPAGMTPLAGLQMDVLENGPAYVQWNIPLYDDNVLWVVPGSFRRPNTQAENRQLLANPRVPLPGSIPVELNAGDGVVYINLTLHWGSNYSAKLRRTIHGGYRSIGGPLYPYNPQSCNWDLDMRFTEYLSAEARATFEGWAKRLAKERDLIEAVFRAVICRGATDFRTRLAELHPGEKGRVVCVMLLSKIAKRVHTLTRPEIIKLPVSERAGVVSSNRDMLNFYENLARRFSGAEGEQLWQRFASVDAKLQADTPQAVPGRPQQTSAYYYYEMPGNYDVEDFIASWESH